MHTIFGLALVGPVSTKLPRAHVQSFFCAVGQKSDNSLQKFWELEEVPPKIVESPDDVEAENIFTSSLSRSLQGRFCVALPFKGNITPKFVSSRDIADRRLLAQERRLSRQPVVHELYMNFMKEYLDSGHMSFLSGDVSLDGYFIPHHCVFKEENSKQKIRVVFDASAKDGNQLSLNETLLVGPKLQNDIVSLLLRFRSYPIVFTCDIRQMYRQILVSPEHRRYQLIRFRFDETTPIQTYQLNTVTYGLSSSPFLAIRTLLELAKLGEETHPLAVKVIRNSLYVDDLICGVSSVLEALELQRQLIDLLISGGFELRKWSSNCNEVLDKIPPEHRQLQNLSFDNEEDTSLKILGLRWKPSSDGFLFNVVERDVVCTKRAILSEAARIYDPLGFLCPVTLVIKRLLKSLWIAGIGWDDTPSQLVQEAWTRFKSELSSLGSLEISRWVLPPGLLSCQLHGFSDASENGYAAVVYLRCVHPDTTVTVHLAIAKSKVSPIARLSIPRLELCGAVLLSKLIAFVVTTYQDRVTFRSIYAWIDSTVTLHWIRSSPHRWKVFVANRISYIQERVSPECWRYVPSENNVADLASRGLFPSEMLRVSSWWAGPDFLSLPPESWPKQPDAFQPAVGVDIEERKITLVAQTSNPIALSLLSTFSSLNTVCGIVAYVRRFIRYKLNQSVKFPPGTPCREELHESLLFIVKAVQHKVFADIFDSIRCKRKLPKWLARLSPFMDEDQVLRVGGRLVNSSLSYTEKHPALIPKFHRITELIVRQTHLDNFHTGINATLYLVQQNFWILSGRSSIRHYLSQCNRCFRVNPSTFQPIMGNLPSVRVTRAKPFSVVGCDYAGPFSITMSRARGANVLKAYLCLFVCFATKAVHLELVSSLSTEAFLAALRRFIARRGSCTLMFSDCGTNFVGANRELAKLYRQVAQGERIQWSFNPPSAPHFGGIWESGVQSVKTHLSRVIGEQILSYEELNTVFVQIEAILNSRPLGVISSDPNDLNCLTPGHFLNLEPPSSAPDPDLSHLKLSYLSRWQLVQRVQQDFWKRWRQEYLHTLHQRSKWFTSKRFIHADVGVLVLVKDDLTPPLRWSLGRIVELHPGNDGVPRVATVRTVAGNFKRPLTKLCALPTQ